MIPSLDSPPQEPFDTVARAALVNRTHRVVRERALGIQARKKHVRSLWIPLSICGGLLALLVCAIWNVLEQYELTPNGLPDASGQMLVLSMWLLPLSIGTLAVVWSRRSNARPGSGDAR